MQRIQILPDLLVKKIAAGEVVERPFSVVKELVENSIDAYSSKIGVDIEEGGRKRICVTDDGVGMGKEDCVLSLSNHATSKINDADDLFSIETLGFRGEAIPSISSVSRFSIKSRTEDEELGTYLEVTDGNDYEIKAVNTPKGTEIIVKELFFNIPARQKFLKTANTEFAHIMDYLTRMALCYPAIHFSLNHNGKLIYNYPSAKNRKMRVAQVFGFDKANSFIEVAYSDDFLTLSGFVGSAELARANMKSQFLFVNGRSVRDATISHAANAAFETMIPKGQFPTLVLFLEISPDLVDVNVHPAKREVRFVDKNSIYSSVYGMIREKLRREKGEVEQWRVKFGGSSDSHQSLSVQSVVPRKAQILESQGLKNIRSDNKANSLRGSLSQNKLFSGAYFPSAINSSLANNAVPSKQNPNLREMLGKSDDDKIVASVGGDLGTEVVPVQVADVRYIGQFSSCYLLFEYDGQLSIVDQHALHERMKYEDMMGQYRSGKIEMQQLIFPDIVDVPPGDKEFLEEWRGSLLSLGFDFESYSGNSIAVKAVPQVLSKVNSRLLFDNILQEIKEIGIIANFEGRVSDIIARLACHRSVRSGEKLSDSQVTVLINKMRSSDYFSTCPHGRNVLKSFSLNDVKRMFDRI